MKQSSVEQVRQVWPSQLTWRKSSLSNGDPVKTSCVEIAASGARVGVRDSKAPRTGHLLFPTGAWDKFVSSLAGES
jgi:uncharacterized protein DUF397